MTTKETHPDIWDRLVDDQGRPKYKTQFCQICKSWVSTSSGQCPECLAPLPE